MKHLFIACLVTWSLAVGAQRLYAADAADTPTTLPAPRAKAMPFYGQVKKVDKEEKTLTLVGKEKDRVFLLNSLTKIHDGGETKTIEDIKIGRHVGGRAEANAGGEWVITTLNLGVKQGRQSGTQETADGP
jgi:hypothetical protein